MFQKHEIILIENYLSKYHFTKPAGNSGHAIGEPFEQAIYHFLKQYTPTQFFRQHELLNHLYLANPNITGLNRIDLIPSRSLQHLLNRGKKATLDWSAQQQFSEKQDDTADIVRLISPKHYGLLDVKTVNTKRSGPPPNIISAFKLAEMCKILLEENQFDHVDMFYLGIEWLEKDKQVYTQNCHFIDLFKTDPKELYINWAAGMQVQFHPARVSQHSGSADKESWAKTYLKHYVASGQNRIREMQKKFVNPYLEHI